MKKPRQSPAHYPIRAVSRLTGIGIDTLRAWERRHDAVTPVRDERGRMYTDADVARLRLLRQAVEQGHSIGRLAGLTDTDLHRLAVPAVRPGTRSGATDIARYRARSALRCTSSMPRESTRRSRAWPPCSVLSTCSATS